MIGFPSSLYSFTYNISLPWGEINSNTKYALELIKRRSKVQETNMSCEHALNFNQWKTFSKNYKPMRAWLRLVDKFTENYYPSRLLSEFIQAQKRYPTSPDEIRILTWKLFFLGTKLLENLLLAKYIISVTAPLISVSF